MNWEKWYISYQESVFCYSLEQLQGKKTLVNAEYDLLKNVVCGEGTVAPSKLHLPEVIGK